MPSPERGSGRPHYPYHYPNRPVFACSGAFRNLRLYSALPPFPTESRQHETTAQRVPLEALHGIDTMNSDELRSPTAFGSGATVTQSPAHGQGDDLDSLLDRINRRRDSGNSAPDRVSCTATLAIKRSTTPSQSSDHRRSSKSGNHRRRGPHGSSRVGQPRGRKRHQSMVSSRTGNAAGCWH